MIGICVKCGKNRIIRKHHWHGYNGEHIDDVVDYCIPCDLKAHRNARQKGRCLLPSSEIEKLSSISSQRRNKCIKSMKLRTLSHNFVLIEQLHFNLDKNISISYHYYNPINGDKEHKILYMDVN